jgi:polar amino acid transport system substrate-binding protein
MYFVRRFAAAVSLIFSCHAASADSYDTIIKRGSIIIGVKPDYKPWGFTDAKGNLDGMEVELARDVAKRLKVKLVLVPALSSNRLQLLNEGKVDMVLATFSVTPERKQQVHFI